MTYQFDTEIAARYGVDEAIMIANFQFWIRKNEANGRHFHDGRYWTYNSVAAMEKLFPFWTYKQIRRVIDSLKKQGAIFTGQYGNNPYDKTTWYALSDELAGSSDCGEGQIREPEQDIRSAQMGKSYSYNNNYTDNKQTDNKQTDNNNPLPPTGDVDVDKKDNVKYNDNDNVQSQQSPPPPKKSTRRKDCVFVAPTLEEVAAFAEEKGAACPWGFADYYLNCQDAAEWMMKNGKKVSNWKLNCMQWLRYHKDEEFPEPTRKPITLTDQQLKDMMR